MNKKEFIDLLAEKMNLKKKSDAAQHAEHFTEAIVEAIKKSSDGKFRFLDFGTFTIVHRKARKGINPRTKEPVDIPAKKVLKFKPSKKLEENLLK